MLCTQAVNVYINVHNQFVGKVCVYVSKVATSRKQNELMEELTIGKKKERCKDVNNITSCVPPSSQSDKTSMEWSPKQHYWSKVATM